MEPQSGEQKPSTPTEPGQPVNAEPTQTTVTPTVSVPAAAQVDPKPAEPTLQSSTPSSTPVQASTEPSKKKRKFAPLAFVVLGAAVLLGGSAAAYFGYVVPNKPDNIVYAALADLVSRKEVVTDLKVDYLPKNEGTAVAITMRSDSNLPAQQFGANGTIGVSGTQYQFDMRYIEKDLYLKVAGLESLAELYGGAGGAEAYADIISQVDNQWYVIDRSFWQSLGQDSTCYTDISFTPTNADMSIIEGAYKKHPLFKVASESKEIVDGVNTTKYVVNPTSDAEAEAFLGELNEVSFVKKAKECAKSLGSDEILDEEVDFTGEEMTGESVSMALYVTDDKQMKKMELTGEDETTKMSLSAVFDFKSVTVAKPEGAKPLQDLLGSFMTGLNSSTLYEESSEL